MASVWVRDALSGRLQLVRVAPGAVALDLFYQEGTAIPLTDFYVKCNGHLADLEEKLQDGHIYSIEPRLCGGKGGFGSMLRALGAQIEKTTNREACRDLSGRRLRDVNHEKAMAEWTKKQADREAEKEQRRLERLQRKLAEPKHYFTDPDYHKQCHDMSERLEEAVIKGLQASSSDVVSAESDDTRKRKKDMYASKGTSSNKKCFWTGLEGLEASSSSDSGSDSDLDESPCSSSSGSKHHENINQRLGSPESPSSSDGLEEASSTGSNQMLKGQTSCSESDNILEGPSSSAGSLHVPQLQSSSKGTEHIQEPQTCPAESEQNTEMPNISDGSEETPTTVTNSECKSVTSAANTGENEQILDDGHKFAFPTLLEPKSELQQSSNTEPSPIDLVAYKTVAELEALGLEKLKLELVALGLKCGGTLQERAARLFSVRGLARDQIDPSLFAKPAKAKKK